MGRAALWALTWALGIAIGVALGGWLTVVSGSGAPGVGGLDVTSDLIVLPLVSGVGAFGVLFLGRLLLVRFRRGPA